MTTLIIVIIANIAMYILIKVGINGIKRADRIEQARNQYRADGKFRALKYRATQKPKKIVYTVLRRPIVVKEGDTIISYI